MEYIKLLAALGLSLPAPGYFFGAIFFGLTGYSAYRYAAAYALEVPKLLGAGLMLLPLSCFATWLLYLVGVALCLGLYLTRPDPLEHRSNA